MCVGGTRQTYDVRYLYWSILHNPKCPKTGVQFSTYQMNRIIALYRQAVGSPSPTPLDVTNTPI